MSNKQVVIASYVERGRSPLESDFAVKEISLPTEADLKDGEILLQTLCLSVDPYMRGRLDSQGPTYSKGFELNSPGAGSGLGRVIASKNSNYKPGDVLTSQKELDWPWQQYVIFPASKAENYHKLSEDFPKELHSATIGWLGMPGLTSYFGLIDRGKPKEGETVVVSGAAGACGSVAGQIAKIKNLRAVGIVSNQQKADYIKSLGYDEAIIYKDKSREQLIEELRKAAPKGVDIYYDNVGGVISNAVISVMNEGGRVPICGQISQYNLAGKRDGLDEDVEKIVEQRKIERGWFMVGQFKNRFDEGWNQLVDWAKGGKLRCEETTYKGIENLPKAFLGLFAGENVGKAVVEL